MSVNVKNRQTLADVTIEHCGNIEKLPLLAKINNRSITDDVDDALLELTPAISSKRIKDWFTMNQQSPATAVIDETTGENEQFGGIEFMGIEIDFKVY